MIISVKVNCNTSRSNVTKVDEVWHISTNAKPVDGKANERVVELLSDHFGVAKSRIRIIRGQKSSLKTIEIDSEK